MYYAKSLDYRYVWKILILQHLNQFIIHAEGAYSSWVYEGERKENHAFANTV